VAILTASDIPGHNLFGPVVKDELLIAEDEVVFVGQPLAIIAAVDREALRAAQRAAIVEIDPMPAILTIDDAIAADSYIGQPRHMGRGDLDSGFARADRIIEGAFDIGGQEHFYLESQICIVQPGEQGQFFVHSSTQHPSEVQMLVAETLGVPFNHVVSVCKRMGGGFGGKETQAAQPAMMAALLARHTRRPVRFAYSKDDDMRFTGKRHPFKIVYRAGFDAEGVITALDLQLYSNGGCSTDLSFAVLERAMLHSDNAYWLSNVRIVARVCRTNLPSNTAFRGFGGPQGVAGIENLLQEIAIATGIDALTVRRRNCYGIDDRNITHYGQLVRNNTLPELFDRIRTEASYDTRRAEIAEFNRKSQTQLKGLAVSAVKFGISFTRKTMNQANALVNIYQDGSVLLSTGATEMGQGVNTRIRQIVADELGIDYGRVLVGITSTEKNNNTSPTAASAGTDLNGAAAMDACGRLRDRLAEVARSMLRLDPGTPVRFADGRIIDERNPSRSIAFQDVVCEAHERRVSLGERGHYATPVGDFNRDTGKGSPFLYYTNGVCCAEVLINRFTGELTVPRVDLIMDAGRRINPGIDRGQTIGGFVQGMGWVTTEQLVYDARGHLLSYSPTTYKIPNISDVPATLNVRFLENDNNDVSIHRSKALGEPPLLLGLSAWLAVKDALSQAGSLTGSLRLPATAEEILLSLPRQRADRHATPALRRA
ncbi:MAG TPA: xanthine dehydrogenase molybdopterin binding subunit, partial [Tepidisphaeraceae bacterium]|nr:xanthine dehydrogenase molybdopterin binding subunit [Tepidisphaeraceae bacterium]